MKFAAISVTDGAADKLKSSWAQGYTTFIYHHADPDHSLVRDKFLYVHSDKELQEKINLLKSDFTVQDLIRL